ncbi:MAG: peptidoglycan DD-metalloendopeptidase family protein [Paludibacteraceae bacterium]|nr:peptidoglycan DD-metalloendopeptidase family protein [Paludibacteraceae bacterium]
MATGVKEGQQYVVDGAIFRCQYGSAPCQIMAISNQKVTAQNKPIVTDKDVTFKIPTAPFVTCSQSKQVPPTCVYANGIWETKTTVKHGDQNAIVEKSEMKCPVCQGKIECIFPGQVQSVSAPELAEFKIETLSNFPLALVVTSPAKNQEEKEKKASSVLSVSASKYKVRSDEVITLHALDNDKKELKPTDIVNWAVTTRKKTEEKVKSKTVSKECIDKLTLIKKVSTPFNISFHEPGIYYIEGGSDKIASKYSELKTGQQLIGDKYPPFDENCKAVVEVLCGNSITGIKKVGDKKAISDTVTVYVKQGGSAVFTPEFKLDYNPDFELLKCSVTKQKGEAVIADDYKFDEGGHSLTLTPSSAEVDYRITFFLYKKTDETIEETPMSEKSILVHSYNEAVLYAYIPGATKGSANGNTTLRRPGDTLIFTVKQKDGKAENLDKIVWNVKKDGKLFEKDIKGEMILYKFKEEGVYTIEADLKGTSLSNGGVKGDILTDFDEESANPENKNVVVLDEVDKRLVNEEGKESSAKSVNGENHKERVITHKLKISRNEVTEVRLGATNGKRYEGVRYTIDPSFLFGDATYRDERNNVVYTCEGADADCLKRGIFLATKPGDYIIKATLNGKERKSLPFAIQDATFSKWEFCDSEKKKISHIGRNMKFGINASVPAWAQNSSDEKKQNKEITVSIFCKGRAIQSFKTKLDEAGSFHIDNIDVEKDIIANAKNIVSFDGIQDLIITFVVNDSPSTIVKGLSTSKVGHGLFSTKANLTVKTKPFVDGYFADKSGKKLVKIVNYVDGSSNNKVTARLNVLNYSKENLKNLMFCLYENKWGIDPIVFKSEDFNLNESGVVEISIPLNEGNIKEKNHGDSKLPRLFYFKVFERKISYSLIDGRPTSTWQKVCAYPKSPGDLYNYNVQAEMSAVQNETLKELSENVAGKDYNSDKLNTARSYYYQLKISKQSEESKKNVNSYNSLAPVVVGEDWEKEEKEEDFQKCHCYRDLSEDFVRKMILKLRGKDENANLDNVWEGTLETKDLDDKSVSRLTRELNACFRKYGISKCIQKIAFLANVCVETTVFKDLDELPSNFESSKSTYKGRGLLHLTGESNYKSYKDKTNIDVVSKPKILSTNIHYAVDSACMAFSKILKMPEWRQESTIKWEASKNLSLNDTALLIESEKGENAKKDPLDYFRLICQKLNGVDVAKDKNPNGWENRKKYYNKIKEIFDYDVKVCQKAETFYYTDEWHDPLDNMMSCFFTQYGNPRPYNSIFCTRSGSNHQGVDLFAKIKTPVYACMDGEILYINENSSSGGKIIYLRVTGRRQLAILNLRKRNYKRQFVFGQYKDDVDQDFYAERETETNFNPKNGITFVYMHLDEIQVRKGDFVTAGQQIGWSGRTGENAQNSQGPHLHFEICSDYYSVRANPAYYLYFKQYRITKGSKIIIYNCDSCSDRTQCHSCEGVKIDNPKVSKDDYSKISYADAGLEEQRKTRLEMRDLNTKLRLPNSR